MNERYDVIIVGTGFGGISAAIELQKRGIDHFILLERRSFAGGTWLQNTYPGAAVDVPSPLYNLSGHPYPWTQLYATQSEIADYTRQTLSKHHLSEKIRTNATVNSATWQGDHWKILLKTGEQFQSKLVINATGPLSTPATPIFEGIENFSGDYFHSNDWQHNVDLNGKNVAVIGSGASAVQIVPAIIDKVRCLHLLQRTPHWLLSRLDFKIPKPLRRLLTLRPIYHFVKSVIYCLYELRIIAFKYSKYVLNIIGTRAALRHLRKQVPNDALRKRLTPNFVIGCKRILISNTYYPAIQRKNCQLHDKDDVLLKFTSDGFISSQSGEHKVDVVIFATGYNAIDSMVSYSVSGMFQQQLNEQWQQFPRAYLGTSVPNFPNFFVLTGPNTGIGHTSAIYVIESQMKYIMRCVEEVLFLGATSIEPTERAEDDYTKMIHKEIRKTVWSYGACDSWYKNRAGKVIAMFPGFSFTFRRLCKRFNTQHHTIIR